VAENKEINTKNTLLRKIYIKLTICCVLIAVL
jgi:hypothetical protein